ncbi:hypothetical protein KJ765_01895 [Candidatus Micrarchaeota archaeon]|nr:hypothetical protein [Candidatus Micrarchaeota archaeon]
MKFLVLKQTARGNLLLQSSESKGIERMPLFYRGKKVAFVFDTIGRVSNPLYLACAEGERIEKIVGKTLRSDRV